MLKDELFTISKLLLIEANKYEIEVTINPDHAIFEGHFPGQPILPGVCLIEIVREILMDINQQTVRMTQAQNIKFLKVVNPRIDPSLKINLEQIGNGTNRLVNATSFLSDGSTNFKLKAEYSLS